MPIVDLSSDQCDHIWSTHFRGVDSRTGKPEISRWAVSHFKRPIGYKLIWGRKELTDATAVAHVHNAIRTATPFKFIGVSPSERDGFARIYHSRKMR